MNNDRWTRMHTHTVFSINGVVINYCWIINRVNVRRLFIDYEMKTNKQRKRNKQTNKQIPANNLQSVDSVCVPNFIRKVYFKPFDLCMNNLVFENPFIHRQTQCLYELKLQTKWIISNANYSANMPNSTFVWPLIIVCHFSPLFIGLVVGFFVVVVVYEWIKSRKMPQWIIWNRICHVNSTVVIIELHGFYKSVSCSGWYTKIAIRVLDKIAAHTKIFNMKLPFIRRNDCFSGIIYSTLSTLLSYIQTVSKPNNILSIFEFWYRLFHSSFARSLPLTFPHVF